MEGGGTQCVKFRLLCQDVKPDQGPTLVISADQSALLAKKLNYKPGTRIESGDDLSNLEELRTFALTGASGSWFATDTDRCFHHGSRTTEESSRLVVIVTMWTTTLHIRCGFFPGIIGGNSKLHLLLQEKLQKRTLSLMKL